MISPDFAEIEYLIAEEALADVLVARHHDEGNLVGSILPQQFLPVLVDEGVGRLAINSDEFNHPPLLALQVRTQFDAVVDPQMRLHIQRHTC